MTENINSQDYWDRRFASGDWEAKNGRWQTQCFAKGQIPHLNIPRDFGGTILDFGCGLGDAIPVYREHFPKARLMGMDISSQAVDLCRRKHGEWATFLQGRAENVPEGIDVIIASNVLEHLDSDVEIAKSLRGKCADLYIVVPYRESPLFGEHVNAYDENHFSALGPCERKIFACRGWSAYGVELWYRTYFKNLIRFLRRRPLRRRNLQILFHFKGSGAARTSS
jgi:SAM-dependent methyltransferase